MALKIAAKVAGTGGDGCCCGDPCQMIPMSICSEVLASDICGYPEFTCAESGTEGEPGYQPEVKASCPPKYYRKKTTTYSYTGTLTHVTSCGDDMRQYSYEVTEEGEKDKATSCVETTTSNGSSWSTWHTACPDTNHGGGGTPDYRCDGTLTDGVWHTQFSSKNEAGDWQANDPYCDGVYDPNTGMCCYTDYIYNPETESYDPTEVCYDPFVGWGPCEDWLWDEAIIYFSDGVWSSSKVETTPTSSTYTYLQDQTSTLIDARAVRSHVITVTLSDEIPYSEILNQKVCHEERCMESEEDPDCRYCCTDRGSGNRDGMKWSATPSGCVTPDGSYMAFDSSPCGTSGTISGRGTSLSLVAKDLVVGQSYRMTVLYKSCPMPTDPETGDTIYPNCEWVPPCGDGTITISDTIEFVGEAREGGGYYWAEVVSGRCDACDISAVICELEDEANTWNIAHADEIAEDPSLERWVKCTTGGFDVPVFNKKMTWADSCTLTKI